MQRAALQPPWHHERVPPVSVITVAYNSSTIIGPMLHSVPAGVECIVVDNASNDTKALRQICTTTGAQLIESDRNLGFGAACNRGAAAAHGELLLFLNPDAILTPGALEQLIAAAERHPEASAMNPRIKEHDGSPFFMRKSYLMPRSRWMPRGWPDQDQEVTVLSGAAMMVRTPAFQAIGGFDEQLFLYHEDDDLSIRLHRECGPLMFVRDAVVEHGGGASSGDAASISAFKAWHMGRSRVYGARKHGRPFAATRAIAHALIQLFSPALLWSRRKRAKQVAYLRGCLSGAVLREKS
ncbi:MAG: glycosyltransferase family 2 protein [Phycisphaerae bacterium]|nr:glycosyltransferase family 2 protein [Phycisphaerae bacterium]